MTLRYAASNGPLGAGDGVTPSSAYQVWNFWYPTRPQPGDILVLLDGDGISSPIYTGEASMIAPAAGVHGITIKAQNDGKVLIDGQQVRVPLALGFHEPPQYYGNDYVTVEGVNCRNGYNYSVHVSGTGCVLRRVIGWDSIWGDANHHNFSVNGYSCLAEDCAAFGGRYGMDCAQMGVGAPTPGGPTIFRRCFSVFKGSNHDSPSTGITYWYASDPVIWENCISTWDGMPVQRVQGVMGGSFCGSGVGVPCSVGATKIFGHISYIRAGYVHPNNQNEMILCGVTSKVSFTDCIGYVEPGHPYAGNLRAFYFGDEPAEPSVSLLEKTLTNFTGVAAGYAGSVGSTWQQSNVRTGNTLGDVYPAGQSLWRNDGIGAKIGKRYVNGVLTSEGLFPWLMNQRILDAMTLAYGSSKAIDITAALEQMFGTIPPECRWDTGQSFPAVLNSPAPGTAITASPATFSWSAGFGVTEYWLDIGTSPGGTQIHTQSYGTNLSTIPPIAVPLGVGLYVRLWSVISGSWQYNDYAYTPAVVEPPASWPEPAPGPPASSGTKPLLTWKT